MKVLIIYDSFFGNTEKIARSIGDAIGSKKDVGVYRVSNVKLEQLRGVEFLIVGSPTRAFRPTPAIKAFVKSIPKKSLVGVKVAAFDTRTSMNDEVPAILRFFAGVFGYASKPIAGKLEKKGGELVLPPEGFFVKGTEGPLLEGELQRAADWAKKIKKG
jgi:flavodoxin I